MDSPRTGRVDERTRADAPWSPAALRRRKEVLAFVAGLTLFAAGAASLARNHQRTASQPLEGVPAASEEAVPGAPLAGAVGPTVGSPVGAYVDRRRAALKKLAAAKPREASWAVVSFDSYREPEAVTSFVAGKPLTVSAFQQRVAIPGFAPETVQLGERALTAALRVQAGAALATRLDRERADLAALVPTVGDAAYRQVYSGEVRRLAEAVRLLRTRPATVFALVVRGRNDALSRASRLPGVRLVDVAEGPPGSGGTFGLLPEDVRTVTFGFPGD